MAARQHACLTMISGHHAGKNYPLRGDSQNSIGRGNDCTVTLIDPLASRVHAKIVKENGRWVLTDDDSRNGTQVNGQKVEQATLDDGHTIRIGRSEFVFRLSDEPATASDETGVTQTIVQDAPVVDDSEAEVFSPLPSAQQIEEMMLLYQLTIRLLGSEGPDAVIEAALDLVHGRTKAAVVGFLWVNDEG